MGSLAQVIDFFDKNTRGSALFTSKAVKPSQFTKGRNLAHVFLNDTEHINHDLDKCQQQPQVNMKASVVEKQLRAYFEQRKQRTPDEKFDFRVWIIANNIEPNPYLKGEENDTMCLWAFFRVGDPYTINGFGDDGSLRWHVYGHASQVWDSMAAGKRVSPLGKDKKIASILDKINHELAFLKPIILFDP